MASVGTMVLQIEGLLGTKDLTDWESGFVAGIKERRKQHNNNTTFLTRKQVEVVQKIWDKYFA